MVVYLIVLSVIGLMWSSLLAVLSIRRAPDKVPAPLADVVSEEDYKKSCAYFKVNSCFVLSVKAIDVLIFVAWLVWGGFGWWAMVVQQMSDAVLLQGLLYIGGLMLAAQLLSIHSDIYHTFVIEEQFGFNRTTAKTFVLDRIKSLLLGVMLGAPLLALILWILQSLDAWSWALAWAVILGFQLLMLVLAPRYIFPLFNKFERLPDGELRRAVDDYAKQQNFTTEEIYQIDGSRRSTKSNAFFTGLGKRKRIAFFDTLIKEHSVDELITVLAHEVGHDRGRHLPKMIITNAITSGLYLAGLAYIYYYLPWPEAFGLSERSFHAGLIIGSLLIQPFSVVMGWFTAGMSRQHEFEADHFAVQSTHQPEAFIRTLKVLSNHNLSYLTPHPLKVLSDSHPPVLERIKCIQKKS